jgi:tRNA-2-methylthio-N6-dimethylallyladenosine synthase
MEEEWRKNGHEGTTRWPHLSFRCTTCWAHATLALVREIGIASAYSFKYSPRPGTPAARAPFQVPEAVKDDWLRELQALMVEQQLAFNNSRIGAQFEVLITGPGRHPGQIAGRSPWLQAVHAEGPETLTGQVVRVEAIAASANSLHCVLKEPQQHPSEQHAA